MSTSPDVLVIPGGWGTRALMKDPEVLDWVRTVHSTSTWTTSVCTGALLLAGAGLLEGKRATTHWLARDVIAEHGAIVAEERVVRDGKIITAAGVSSGIDMALTLAAELPTSARRGDPAADRVRPAAAVRRRLAGEGAGRHRRGADRRRGEELLGRRVTG